LRERRSPTGRVVHRLLREHGHEYGEEAISNTTQRPAVAVAMPTEPPVMLATVRVVPHADEAPVVKRVAKARIAGVAQADEEAFPALPRHGRDAGLGAQAVIVSGGQEPRGLGKHRSGDDSPDTWQGPKDRHVTMPLMLSRRGEGVQQVLDAPRAVSPLAIDEFEAWKQQRYVGARRLHRARGHPERSAAEHREHLVSGQPADAMLAQERHHGGPPESLGRRGRGREFDERPEPGLVGGRAQRKQLRRESMKLFAQSISEAPPLLAQLVLDPRPLAKLDDQGRLELEPPESRSIGRQGSGQYERVPTIVLGARDRVAVAEAVELLGVEREDVKASPSSVSTTAPRGTSNPTATRAGSPPVSSVNYSVKAWSAAPS
jgi:hypothetical protein